MVFHTQKQLIVRALTRYTLALHLSCLMIQWGKRTEGEGGGGSTCVVAAWGPLLHSDYISPFSPLCVDWSYWVTRQGMPGCLQGIVMRERLPFWESDTCWKWGPVKSVAFNSIDTHTHIHHPLFLILYV